MTSSSSTTAPEARHTAYRVEAPRASDAIGHALRGAYADEGGLPDDMAAILRQLNRMDDYPTH
ncbi:MAG: hypothetical protein KF730_06625 [Sphingomonas sp.]|uniref:hypothetical protein n=1 Tax=Sphingomonas sp. TaxID=28214 RepID=UPI0025F4ABDA|nr:hypothetical protein [Sphingomonas sp.]MBX3564238.1 hypothetical protein [Sphingomonas sp.]